MWTCSVKLMVNRNCLQWTQILGFADNDVKTAITPTFKESKETMLKELYKVWKCFTKKVTSIRNRNSTNILNVRSSVKI